MQSAKDSFYIALRDRLAALAPERTVTIGGQERPAVLAAENEPVTSGSPQPDAFYLHWEGVRTASAAGARRPLLRLECRIAYRTQGSSALNGVDRGRALAALDLELCGILAPHFAEKKDYSQPEPQALGSAVLWSAPEFAAAEAHDNELRRVARVALFFWPEVELP
jgi:hypothetical protein